MRRRKTPYVTAQTWTLIAIQWIPLFILPVLLLPWMGANGFFAQGAPLRWFADTFFDLSKGADAVLGADREYWRSYGFIFAWPLLVGNWFTAQPMIGWLVLGFIQTFVIIPWMVRRWGKGAYCGWICSCGALAETLGDQQRHKMPHGPKVNRWNMVGQIFLGFAFLLLGLRIVGWIFPGGPVEHLFHFLYKGLPGLSYDYFVDLIWSGVIGVSLYFHLSGRVWCRFACPLAALMHIYARFSKFRIFPEKKKCISCNVCTSVCHQGIDIMNFANKGMAMEDPECVRCSACVQQCPTGVLSFGRLGEDGVPILDKLAASRVQMLEKQKAAH
jgi:polyferredoxin